MPARRRHEGERLADATVQTSLSRLDSQTQNTITNQCGADRVPDPTLNFCCRCGTGMSAMCTDAPATRGDCLAIDPMLHGAGGQGVQHRHRELRRGAEDITWWAHCPESDTAPGPRCREPAINLIDCVEASADAIVDELALSPVPGLPLSAWRLRLEALGHDGQ